MRTLFIVPLALCPLAVYVFACSATPLTPLHDSPADALDIADSSEVRIAPPSMSDVWAAREQETAPSIEIGDHEVGRADATTLASLKSAAYVVWGSAPTEDDHVENENGEDDPSDNASTYLLASDGSVTSRIAYPVVLANGKFYAWSVRKVAAARTACWGDLVEGLEGDGDVDLGWMKKAATDERADLTNEPTRDVSEGGFVNLESGALRVVASFGEYVAQDFNFETSFVGSAGSVVFVREHTWAFNCGAHGSSATLARAIDLAAPSEAPIDLEREIAASTLARAHVASSAILAERTKEWSGDWDASAPADLVEVRPIYANDGALAFEARYSASAPYAASSQWRSYSVTAAVPLDTAPSRFAQAKPPAAIRSFVNAHPSFAMRGWSSR